MLKIDLRSEGRGMVSATLADIVFFRKVKVFALSTGRAP